MLSRTYRLALTCILIGQALFLAGCRDSLEVEESSILPNVIIIMADDLGYGDLGAYGQEKILTPRLDQMAFEGTRFSQFYSGSTVCAPSRSTLVTGQHTGNTLVRNNATPTGAQRGDGVPLRPGEISIARIMKQAGYATGMFGKWSLGAAGTTGAPNLQGFDAFTGYLNQVHAHSYNVNHLWTIEAGEMERKEVNASRYSHDVIMEDAFAFVREHKDEPFFLYLPLTLPHAELVAPEAAVEAYLDENGRSLFAPERRFEGSATYRPQDMPNATLAAMISTLDRDTGRLLDLLKSLNLHTNTLVLFTSDNGPHAAGGRDPEYFDSNGPLRGIKRDLYEGGIRVPMIAWGPGLVPPNQVSDHIWAMWDLLPTVADVAGMPVPARTDGISALSAITGRGLVEDHAYLYWEFYHPGRSEFAQAVRENNWKALRFETTDGEVRRELYDLSVDLGEQENVVNTYPRVASRLFGLMESLHARPEHPVFYTPYDSSLHAVLITQR